MANVKNKIQVTPKEKVSLEIIKTFDELNLNSNIDMFLSSPILYYRGAFHEFINPALEKKLIKKLSNTLLPKYKQIIKVLSKKNFYNEFSKYSPNLVRIGFEKEIPQDCLHTLKYYRTKTIKEDFVKRYTECIFITDIEKAQTDLELFLNKNYSDQGPLSSSASKMYEHSPYINILVKRHELPYYIKAIKSAITISNGELQFLKDESMIKDKYDSIRIKNNISFFNSLLNIFDNANSEFTLKIHAVFMEDLLSTIEIYKEIFSSNKYNKAENKKDIYMILQKLVFSLNKNIDKIYHFCYQNNDDLNKTVLYKNSIARKCICEK